jgi:hypothetical protein
VAPGGLLILAFVEGVIVAILALWVSVPLDSLAAPTTLCVEEIVAVSAVFLVFVAVMQPARDALERSESPITRLMRLRVKVPGPVRVAALGLFAFGSFFFAFWAAADVLGGYSGYSYSFSWYPIFPLIYNNTIGLVPYVSSRDKGTQASIFICLAVLGLVVFRLNRGMGAALKDAITLFVAPCVVVFELALWILAPEDMTWHVTDFLWMGGIADGGIRENDFVRVPFANYAPGPGGHFLGTYASGPYVFSNWFVLFVALILVASRIPWMSVPSTRLWRRNRAGQQQGDASAPPAKTTAEVGDGGPAGRTISALSAFEPTTLRFLWPEQAGRVGRGRPLQPEAVGSFTDLPG